ncbi:hypothetical protein ABZX40_13330 [Streptomyces sp. NPDC004610]|uniref:hypothetical protein n=1 Tax=unclassified Streptomyces TaxID=2593676 RepID=UPI0033A32ACF
MTGQPAPLIEQRLAEDETPWHSANDSYIQPGDRVAEWARMARQLAYDGHQHAAIAARLCVDTSTVERLLAGEVE